MAITIHSPLGFTYQGQRENNEDSIYPPAGEATAQHRFFIVCDGVGGAQKGELASHIAVTGFVDYFAKHPSSVYSEAVIKAAFAYVLEQFDAMLQQQHLLRGMATTLTFVGIGEKEVTVAHIGDSRIYQIRQGVIVFKSEDHSKVNYLLKTGLITEQQAKNHPERNVITRAIQGSHKETDIEINHLTDVQSGDYFFQCTDGVLENVTDEALCQILDSEQPDTKKLQLILNLCEGNTRDNYSGYLVQIAEVGESLISKEWVEPIQVIAPNEIESTFEVPVGNKPVVETPSPAKSGQGFWFLGAFVLLIGLAVGTYWFLKPQKISQSSTPLYSKPPPEKKPDTVQISQESNPEIKKTLITSAHSKRSSSTPKKAVVAASDSLAKPEQNGVTANTLSFSKKKNQDTVQKKIPGG
jgi:serine/threonine protein phosphatase PrpC